MESDQLPGLLGAMKQIVSTNEYILDYLALMNIFWTYLVLMNIF